MHHPSTDPHARNAEAGMLLILVAFLVLPLLLLTATTVTFVSGKTRMGAALVSEERALQAAESGVDHAVYLANLGKLEPDTGVGGVLAADLTWTAMPVSMLTDRADNDGDGDVDEPDEDGFEVTVTGRHRNVVRKVVAYVRPRAKLPPIRSAVSISDPNSVLDINGNSFRISGNDTKLDGTAGSAPPIYGITVNPPGTVAGLIATLSLAQRSRITGRGGPPSVGIETSEVAWVIEQMRMIADNVLAPGSYTSVANFGDAGADEWRITYCPGNLQLSGNVRGAGILAVDGDLELGGTVTFTGIVLVKGNVRFSGGGAGKAIRGALMVGGDAQLGDVFRLGGTVDILYCSEAIAKIRQLVQRVTVAGWREVARS